MNIKKIIIITIFSIIIVELYHVIVAGIFIPAAPDEELKKAIEFLQKDDYVGMTVEECEELLGEEAIRGNERVYFDAGTYRYCKDVEYVLMIRLNDAGKVIYAELQGVG